MKHKLKLEELSVDSFETVGARREKERGTVRGFEPKTNDEFCRCSVDEACAPSGEALGSTCWESCPNTCNGTCLTCDFDWC